MNKMFYIFTILSLGCFSCGDFLKEYSSDLAYASSCKDLEEVLLGEGYIARPETRYEAVPEMTGTSAFYFPWIHVMDDDTKEYLHGEPYSRNQVALKYSGFFCWQQDPFMVDGVATTDETWSRLYKHIGALNVILNKIDEFKEDPLELRNKLKGETYFLRAYYYFVLVNIYAKPYDKNTAETDPGVPLKLTEYIEDKYYSRDNIAAVYKQIVDDLKKSTNYFSGILPESPRRASEAAAHLLLSRVYLYMGEWENAVAECNKIKGAYFLEELNGRDETKSFIYETSPELIFSQGPYVTSMLLKEPDRWMFCYEVSDDLLGTYDQDTDLRLKHFFKPSESISGLMLVAKMREEKDWVFSDVCLLRYAEVLLNKAEALAMLDRYEEAVEILTKLLESRLTKVEPVGKTGKELIDLIRLERRKELCMEGHRWFDLRRYAVNPRYPFTIEIRHDHYNLETQAYEGTYLLKKYGEDAGGYVMPIPDYAITFNNGLLTDNERGVRESIK